ncbi:uncharacterized protein FIBRA_06337 [Fibroporia radiculosa]|uniref:SH3 domain-containing protein n=1 Tax=Fibroporia radiculosa TaxID=599839 RepID=J4GSK1_9APHY|nr:uncharacterized protein FIBRA_06337 [Fibroporia radiculosa]CCM04175.1 predicted protein [Fibroporia radiculosa]
MVSRQLDFAPILTNYVFSFTAILAVIGWFVAFVAQAISTRELGYSAVGVLWVAIFFQLFLAASVLYTLASDTTAIHRHLISVFGVVAIAFAVIGINNGIFSGHVWLGTMGAGWLINVVVDILWVLYFSSAENSFVRHAFDSMGTVDLPPTSPRLKPEAVVVTTPELNLAGIGAGGGVSASYRALRMKAMFGYDADPNSVPPELSFAVGEILEIVNTHGDWWRARNLNGDEGIVPSNFLVPSVAADS